MPHSLIVGRIAYRDLLSGLAPNHLRYLLL